MRLRHPDAMFFQNMAPVAVLSGGVFKGSFSNVKVILTNLNSHDSQGHSSEYLTSMPQKVGSLKMNTAPAEKSRNMLGMGRLLIFFLTVFSATLLTFNARSRSCLFQGVMMTELNDGKYCSLPSWKPESDILKDRFFSKTLDPRTLFSSFLAFVFPLLLHSIGLLAARFHVTCSGNASSTEILLLDLS